MPKNQIEKQASLPEPASVLPAKVAEKYALSEGTLAKFSDSTFGLVDLSKIDLQLAEQLAEHGYLIKR